MNNEYGKLHDAFIGIGDEKHLMHPTYMDAFKWQNAKGMEECEKYGGKFVVETTPDPWTRRGKWGRHEQGPASLSLTGMNFKRKLQRGWFESHYVQHVQEMRTVTYPSFLRQHRSAEASFRAW